MSISDFPNIGFINIFVSSELSNLQSGGNGIDSNLTGFSEKITLILFMRFSLLSLLSCFLLNSSSS